MRAVLTDNLFNITKVRLQERKVWTSFVGMLLLWKHSARHLYHLCLLIGAICVLL